jgi:hypothetical protein
MSLEACWDYTAIVEYKQVTGLEEVAYFVETTVFKFAR